MVRIEIERNEEVPETLADVEPYVLCLEAADGGPCWQDLKGNAICCGLGGEGKPFLANRTPSGIKIREVLGPFRLVVDPE